MSNADKKCHPEINSSLIFLDRGAYASAGRRDRIDHDLARWGIDRLPYPEPDRSVKAVCSIIKIFITLWATPALLPLVILQYPLRLGLSFGGHL